MSIDITNIKVDAVRNLVGQLVTFSINKNNVITSWSGDVLQPTQEEIDAEVTRLQAVYDAQEYARDRATEYPTIGDQLDMLWHAIDTGDWTAAKVKLTSFYTELKAVKDKYPKE